MTVWLIVIAATLLLILAALEKRNSIKAGRAHAKRERHEKELLNAEERREYDLFFAANGHPHRNDGIRVAAWGAQRGMKVEEAREFLSDCKIHDHIRV